MSVRERLPRSMSLILSHPPIPSHGQKWRDVRLLPEQELPAKRRVRDHPRSDTLTGYLENPGNPLRIDRTGVWSGECLQCEAIPNYGSPKVCTFNSENILCTFNHASPTYNLLWTAVTDECLPPSCWLILPSTQVTCPDGVDKTKAGDDYGCNKGFYVVRNQGAKDQCLRMCLETFWYRRSLGLTLTDGSKPDLKIMFFIPPVETEPALIQYSSNDFAYPPPPPPPAPCAFSTSRVCLIYTLTTFYVPLNSSPCFFKSLSVLFLPTTTPSCPILRNPFFTPRTGRDCPQDPIAIMSVTDSTGERAAFVPPQITLARSRGTKLMTTRPSASSGLAVARSALHRFPTARVVTSLGMLRRLMPALSVW